jgi:hypothetical protein
MIASVRNLAKGVITTKPPSKNLFAQKGESGISHERRKAMNAEKYDDICDLLDYAADGVREARQRFSREREEAVEAINHAIAYLQQAIVDIGSDTVSDHKRSYGSHRASR